MVRRVLFCFVLVVLFSGANALDRRPSLGEVSAALAKASPQQPPNLAGLDLSYLDLSGLNFNRANLRGANLYGADLSDCDLSHADLSHADLDHALIIRTNFTGADLSNASMYAVVTSSSLQISRREAPILAGANLEGARIVARLSQTNLSGANLKRVQMGADRRLLRTNLFNDLSGSDLTAADLSQADLREVPLAFARLVGAKLLGANLAHSDLFHADLTAADLTGADLSGANVTQAILKDTRGLGSSVQSGAN